MNQKRSATILGSLLASATLLPIGQAGAGPVSVTRVQCAAEVTVQANEAMLSEVFSALSAELGFSLLFDRGSDRSVTIDTTRAPEKLIESLTRDDNVMITTADDPDCAGQQRITDIRFLAAGDPIFFPAHKPATVRPMQAISVRKSHSSSLKLKDKDKKSRRDMTPEERQMDRQRTRQEKRR